MQTDEHPLDRAAGGGPSATRQADAQRRALEALARMIPGDDADLTTDRDGDDASTADVTTPEVVIDLTDSATGHRWATAAKAARLAGVAPSTVRQWARHGVILRQHREEGGHVVDLEAVLDAATHAGPGDEPPSGHVLAKIMQLQRDRALQELQRIDREVEEAVVEIEFLRHQLEFAAAENRGLRVSLDQARQEGAALRAGALTTEASEAEAPDAEVAARREADRVASRTQQQPEPVHKGPPPEPVAPAPFAALDALRGNGRTSDAQAHGRSVPTDDLTPSDVAPKRRRRRTKGV